MTIRAKTDTPTRSDRSAALAGVSWSAVALANGDRGEAVEFAAYSDASIQVTGTFDTSTVKMQGSNLPNPATGSDTDWFTIDDPQGVEIAITAAGAAQLGTIARWLRPAVTAGGGSTALAVHMIGRRR